MACGGTPRLAVTVRAAPRFGDKDSIFFRYSSNRTTLDNRGWGLGPADPAARKDQRDNHNAIVRFDRSDERKCCIAAW